MEKINSLADLIKMRTQLSEATANNKNTIVNVSLGTCSIASGGQTAMNVMKAAVSELQIPGVEFTQSGCMCYCFAEPTVEVRIAGQDPVLFGYVDEARAQQIVERFIKNGEPVEGVIPVNYQIC